MEPFPFTSPSNPTLHPDHSRAQSQSQSQSQSQGQGHGQPGVQGQNQGPSHGIQGIEDIDLEALLAQLTNAQPHTSGSGSVSANANGDSALLAGINLEDLFASVDNAAATDDALAEDMMKFLAGLENDTEPDENGDGTVSRNEEGDGTAGPSTANGE
jgi:hypothetical protein